MPNAYTGRVTALNPAMHDMALRITVLQYLVLLKCQYYCSEEEDWKRP